MKFAYIIMAHNNEWQLRVLLKSLDYPENEIFLHIDKKSKELEKCNLTKDIRWAQLHIYSVYDVYWADISQTKCQIYMLNQAVASSYHDYYHLLSGNDLPIKPHSTILKFFEENVGKQFVHFESNEYCLKNEARYYHFFEPLIVRMRSGRIRRWLRLLENRLLKIQINKGVRRPLYCGANWYSITQELADDFLTNKSKMLRKVRYTISSDEYILQTFVRENAGKYTLYNDKLDNYQSIMRNIDWQRGNPYVWRMEDYDKLIESNYLFARKFDEKVDRGIIERVSEYVNEYSETYNET